MKPVSTIDGIAAALPRANIDTDQIIPKQFLKRVERHGYGEFLFYDWARDLEGELDPDFVLNRPNYREAVVLITGPNFGSGSSREHAAWALQDAGFEAVIASSFGDIFRTNAYNVGLLAIELSPDEVDTLLEVAEAAGTVRVDLSAQTVEAGGHRYAFAIDPHVKRNLLRGLDRIGLTLEHDGEITGFERRRPRYRPALGA